MYTQLLLLRGDTNNVPLDHLRAYGYNVQTTMADAVRGLRHLHELRGFEMTKGVKRNLERFITKLDRKV